MEDNENIMQEQSPAEAVTENMSNQENEDLDDDSLPFPRARIVNIMRGSIPEGKQLRSEVKDAMNIWLGNLLKGLAKEMGNTQYGSVGISDFQRATKPYDMISDVVKDEQRLMAGLEKIKMDADAIQREFDRFFVVLTGKERHK